MNTYALVRAAGKLLSWSLLVVTMLLVATSVLAQHDPERAAAEAAQEQKQPGNNAPLWTDIQAMRRGVTAAQTIDAGVLINPGGEFWRKLHEGPFPLWGAIWLAGVPGAILLFWLFAGPIKLHAAETGRLIRRFASWERALHWTVAACFLILAVSGLTLFFGKYYVEALLTYPVYSWLAKLAVTLHNVTAPVFAVSLVLLFAALVKRNWWRTYDWGWLRRLGGFTGQGEPPSGFFNAGEKLWFWCGVTALGLVMIVSGAVLLLPVYNQTRDVLAAADIVHLSAALLLVGASFGHIYMGTIGMHGALGAMRDGAVDETWAKEHHTLWHDDLLIGRAHEASDAPLLAPTATPENMR
jgi:formate dehydrogenase subunit gamma